MLVLGVIRIFQPVHGYDVRRELVQWHAAEWGNVAPGSIYSALKTLVKEEMIEVVGTEHVGGRPERTSYRLTTRGERELGELLHEALWTVKTPIDPLVAVVSIMGFLKRDELIAALEARSAQISGAIAHADHAIRTVDDVETPAHVREMLRLLNARMGSELAWAKGFVARLQAGEYDTADDPPWREQAAAKREKAERAKPERAKPERAKPEHAKPEHAKPEHAKPEHAKPEHAKQAREKPVRAKQEREKPERVKSAANPRSQARPRRRG
jgi:DNA-binding PadR family transcriptional regulator